jgi:RimJ/RimL family protein N-acetyltransferase
MIEFHDVYSTNGASQILWDLMLERSEEHKHNISFAMPSRDAHEDYISSTPYPHWYLVEDFDFGWLGMTSLSWRNEIGIVLFREHRGYGYGRFILEKLMDEADPMPALPGERVGHFVANINPLNAQSIHLFESLGFKHIQNTYAYEP